MSFFLKLLTIILLYSVDQKDRFYINDVTNLQDNEIDRFNLRFIYKRR